MEQQAGSPEVERLGAFLGEWSMEAAFPGAAPTDVRGRVVFEWMASERVRGYDPLAGRILDLQSPTVDEVVANPQPSCALVMFVPLPGGLHAFVATPKLTVVKVSDADLSEVAKAVLDWVVEYDEFRSADRSIPTALPKSRRRLVGTSSASRRSSGWIASTGTCAASSGCSSWPTTRCPCCRCPGCPGCPDAG